jgi:hypothetical protein
MLVARLIKLEILAPSLDIPASLFNILAPSFNFQFEYLRFTS